MVRISRYAKNLLILTRNNFVSVKLLKKVMFTSNSTFSTSLVVEDFFFMFFSFETEGKTLMTFGS